MDTYRYNSTSSYAQRPAASVRMAGAQASAADRLWAAPASRGTRRSATGTGHASVGAERRARARTRRSNFMRYATDNRVVQTLYAITTGPWRFAFYGAVALAVAVSIYFPARDYYAAYRTGDILSRQLEVREAYNKELEAKVDKLLSTEGIKETARKKLGLVMPGEHAVEVIGIDDDTSSSDSGQSSGNSPANDADDAAASSKAASSAKKTNGTDGANGAARAADAQGNQGASADAKDQANSAADAGTADAAGSTADQADASKGKTGDAASDDAQSAPSTSAEVEAAERAVAEDAPWYIHVLDALFFYQGVEGQTVSSTGE